MKGWVDHEVFTHSAINRFPVLCNGFVLEIITLPCWFRLAKSGRADAYSRERCGLSEDPELYSGTLT